MIPSSTCYFRLGIFILVSVGSSITWYILSRVSLRFRNFRLVGVISHLHCYPIVSCAGMANQKAICTCRGLKMLGAFDQQFVVGKPTDHTFALSSPRGTFKQFFCQKLRKVEAHCNGRDLLISCAGSEAFQLSLNKEDTEQSPSHLHRAENIMAAVDQGNKVSEWLSEKLETPNVRLYEVISQVFCVTPGRSTFGNYIIVSEDSIEYVNTQNQQEPRLRPNYFRPNIVITGNNPMEETMWRYLRIGSVVFEVLCTDCRFISTRQKSNLVTFKTSWEMPPVLPNNVRLLDGCTFSAMLGVNAKVLVEGEIQVGDPVFAAF